MTDDFDLDHNDEGQEPEKNQRASLKEAWDSNPMLKIAAVVLGLAVLVGGYMTFSSDKSDTVNKSSITPTDVSVKVTPGKDETDEVYHKAVQDQNKANAEAALKSGASSIPVPTATNKDTGISVPDAGKSSADDPLAQWRQKTEAARDLKQDSMPTEDTQAPAPDVVPMVQPIRPQAVYKMDPNEAKALAAQMRVIIGAQAPTGSKRVRITNKQSDYAADIAAAAAEKAKDKTDGVDDGTMEKVVDPKTGAVTEKPKSAPKDTIIPAGDISYAQLLNELNSDIKGPVLAQVLSGPFSGGRAIGEYTLEGDYLVLKFERIVKDGITYTVNGIALDEATTLAAQQSTVDHHYISRILLPAAARFIQGYGQAVAQTGTSSTTTSGGAVIQDTPKPDAKEQLYNGVQEASSQLSDTLQQDQQQTVTVTVHKGTTMGILFMEPVTTASATK